MNKYSIIIFLFAYIASACASEHTSVYIHLENPPSEMDSRVESFYAKDYKLVPFVMSEHEYFGSKITYGFMPGPILDYDKGELTEASGLVHIYYIVDKNGNIHSPKAHVIKGCKCLGKVLEDHIKLFKFTAAALDGKAVASVAMTPFEIKPNNETQSTAKDRD